MNPRDRILNVLLLAGSALVWAGLAIVFTTRSPTGDPTIQAAVAVGLGVAVALLVAPLGWLAIFARRRIAYRGDWTRATRRGLFAGVTVAVLVSLQILGASSLPLAAFIVAMAVFVELILTART